MTRAGRVITDPGQADIGYLERCLGTPLFDVAIEPVAASCSLQAILRVRTGSGTVALRLKCCDTRFGRSEVDYYLADYVDLAGSPLVRCLDGAFDPATGYHLLLQDVSDGYVDRRDRPPTLEHFLAVAEALARMHRHRWESQPAPAAPVLDAYFSHARGGVARLAELTGIDLADRYASHEAALRRRMADPAGLSLLHGDLNPTNILAPAGAGHPVYFLDRQPFAWSITYGLAATDLAYAVVPWSPPEFTRDHAQAIVRHWHRCLGMPAYAWEQAWGDWCLGAEHCLGVPLGWCTEAESARRMRWLWEEQLRRVLAWSGAPGRR